jgi:plasmid stabilization system protein ParE
MKVKWVRLALKDLDDSGEFIAQDNPKAANRVLKRIWDTVQMLSRQILSSSANKITGCLLFVFISLICMIEY